MLEKIVIFLGPEWQILWLWCLLGRNWYVIFNSVCSLFASKTANL